ncbi:MAG TPA: HepT-like ribonuclease domain-containing protein [Candidatus Paceibacterota bacterium]|nr:HepT-like ribonuclease domain-containing protein [Candidatus Paceibacterota bacterium]
MSIFAKKPWLCDPFGDYRLPGIEWKKIAGMRVLIAHAYHRVDIDFIWTIATTSVPDLAQTIRAKFPDLDSEA